MQKVQTSQREKVWWTEREKGKRERGGEGRKKKKEIKKALSLFQ